MSIQTFSIKSDHNEPVFMKTNEILIFNVKIGAFKNKLHLRKLNSCTINLTPSQIAYFADDTGVNVTNLTF